jgi:DNA-binding transcriptional MerR regulator
MEIAEDRQLKIGELARQTGLSIKAIRYYEQRGLLEQPPRTEAGYRLYGPEEVARLQFVQRAKLLGLTLEEIRELVELAARCNEGEIVPHLEEVLRAKLEETERKIAELRGRELLRVPGGCHRRRRWAWRRLTAAATAAIVAAALAEGRAAARPATSAGASAASEALKKGANKAAPYFYSPTCLEG